MAAVAPTDLWTNRHDITKEQMIELYNFCVDKFELEKFCEAFNIDAKALRDKKAEAIFAVVQTLHKIPSAIYSRWPEDDHMIRRAAKAFDHIWRVLVDEDIAEYDDVTNWLCGSDHPTTFFAEDIEALEGWSDVAMNFKDEYAEEYAEADSES